MEDASDLLVFTDFWFGVVFAAEKAEESAEEAGTVVLDFRGFRGIFDMHNRWWLWMRVARTSMTVIVNSVSVNMVVMVM